MTLPGTATAGVIPVRVETCMDIKSKLHVGLRKASTYPGMLVKKS